MNSKTLISIGVAGLLALPLAGLGAQLDERSGADGAFTVISLADGANRSASVSRTGPRGKTVRRDTAANRQPGHTERTTTVTGPEGGVTTRNTVRDYDAETGTMTRASTTTRPNGKTSSSNATVTRTENGYVRSETRTGPNGQTVTREGEGSYDAETNTWRRQATVTGPNGETRQVRVERTVTSSTDEDPAD